MRSTRGQSQTQSTHRDRLLKHAKAAAAAAATAGTAHSKQQDVVHIDEDDAAMDIDKPATQCQQEQINNECQNNTIASSSQSQPLQPINTAPDPGQSKSDAQHALAYLVQRCVTSNRGAALNTMNVRPAMQQLQDQLTASLHSMVQDETSLSLLVLGDPGCGKTLLVERSVVAACAVHNVPGSARVVGVVRLSGLLHHDERVAFQDIARQLCSEFDQEFSKAATFEENLGFLRTMLATLRAHCKSCIFILDGFEQLARARGKQQLLYNLLDVVQHSKVQAAVIGVTCAQDVMESMEKRVRSRFSHRRMMLTGIHHFEVPKATPATAPTTATSTARKTSQSDTDTPITYADTPCGVLQDILTLPVPSSSSQGASTSTAAAAGNAASLPSSRCDAAYVKQHNASVAAAVNDKQVKAELRKLFASGLKPRTLMCVARAALDAWERGWDSTDGSSCPVLTVNHVLEGVRTQLPQQQVTQICDLSVLQLYLVVGMARLENKKQEVYNFEMVWDECQSFHDSKGVLNAFTRDAAWRAFEELVAQNIAYWISPNAEASGRTMRYAGVSLAVPVSDVAPALKQHGRCPDELTRFLNLEA